jgi:hypothetical protein
MPMRMECSFAHTCSRLESKRDYSWRWRDSDRCAVFICYEHVSIQRFFPEMSTWLWQNKNDFVGMLACSCCAAWWWCALSTTNSFTIIIIHLLHFLVTREHAVVSFSNDGRLHYHGNKRGARSCVASGYRFRKPNDHSHELTCWNTKKSPKTAMTFVQLGKWYDKSE